jgi:hypothetical protein
VAVLSNDTMGCLPTTDLNAKVLPPWNECAFVLGDLYLQAAAGHGTREVHPEIVAMLVCEALAIVGVKRTAAIVAGIDAKDEWPSRRFFSALYEWFDGNDGTGTRENRKRVECRAHLGRKRNLL